MTQQTQNNATSLDKRIRARLDAMHEEIQRLERQREQLQQQANFQLGVIAGRIDQIKEQITELENLLSDLKNKEKRK